MMKYKKCFSKFFFIIAIPLAVSCGSSEDETLDSSGNLKRTGDTIEDVLDLGMHPLGADTALNFIDSTNMLLSIGTNQTLNLLLEEIIDSSLRVIRTKSNALHKAHNHTEHYVSAVQIWFRLNNQKIKCLYEPLSLCSGDTGKTKTYTVYNSHQYFIYSNNRFEEASTSDLNEINVYQQNIKFREDLQSNNYRDFLLENNENGDITSVIYTFQELDSVIISNSRNRLNLWSYAYRTNTPSGLKSRHSVLLSPDSFIVNNLVRSKIIRLPFRGRFANLTNPCPPSCSNITFKIY